MACVLCGKSVKPNFNYFCRSCYHISKYKLGVSRSDFRKYLRYGLGVHLHIPEDWNFKQVYDSLCEKHPTLFKLANLIENALFLKFVFRNDLDLKPCRSYPLNDRTASTNSRIVRTDNRWNCCEFNKQTYHQQCLL